MNKWGIQNVAIAEILNPTLEHTRHYLRSNKVVLKDNTPCVKDVILREEEKVAELNLSVDVGLYAGGSGFDGR
ncbi:MAG: hypothetical protein ACRDHW_14675 [Ktedonobacteraceae bacterium]